MSHTKKSIRCLCTLLACLLLLGSFSTAAFAAEKAMKGAYGSLIPTDSKMEAQKTSYTFYGDSANLYFMMFSKGYKGAWYAVEVFSDKAFSESAMVVSATGEFVSKAGSSPLAIKWSFKSTPSGTYYGRCYSYITQKGEKVIDRDSIATFTIHLNRLGRQTVELGKALNAFKGVSLSWDSLRAATMYFVYRKAAGEKSWTRIATVGADTTRYGDTKVKSGTTYTYTVKAYDGKYSSLYNKKGVSVTYLAAPVISALDGAGAAGIAKVQWKAVTGAAGYYLYRMGGSLNNTEWKRIATLKGASSCTYLDKAATSGKWRYTYTVRAYGKNGALSSFDKVGADFNYLAAPKPQKVSVTAAGLTFTWADSNILTEGFYVYRKGGGSSTWKRIATVSKNTYTDTAVVSGSTYTYTVRAKAATNASGYSNTGASSLFLSQPALKALTFNAAGVCKFSWGTVKGAKGYYIYRSVDGGKWARIAMLSGGSLSSYTDKTAKASGSVYKYTVKAVNGSVASASDNRGISGMWLSVPKFTLKNIAGTEGSPVRVSWAEVPGAESYTVYRKAGSEAEWTVLERNLQALFFDDADVKSGTEYTYTVRAFCGKTGSGYVSESILSLSVPVLTDAVPNADGTKLTWEAVPGADSYYIYRRTPAGEWENIGSYSQTEFLDTTAAKDTLYFYTVAAAHGETIGAYDPDGILNFAAVSGLTAVLTEAASAEEAPFATVSWDAVEGAQGYVLLRSVNGEAMEKLADISLEDGTVYLDKTLRQGATYVYSVKVVNDTKLCPESTTDAVKWAFPPVPAVAFTVTSVAPVGETAAHMTITWEKTDTASSYEIYRKTAEGTWEKLAEVGADAEACYEDADIALDTVYTYTVRGVASDRESVWDTDGKSNIVRTPLSPVSLTVLLVDDPENAGKKNAVISWDAVPQAATYQVYRKDADGNWEFLSFTTAGDACTFTDESIAEGGTYTYTVRALATDRASIHNETGVSVTWELPTPPTPPTPPEA